MTVQRATVREMRAPLREEFGRELLAKKFGEAGAAMVLEAFGRFTRGKNKGEFKGFLHWKKTTVGGWMREPGGLGHVQRPGSSDYAVGLGYDRAAGVVGNKEHFASSYTEAQWLKVFGECLAERVSPQRQFARQKHPRELFANWAEIEANAARDKEAEIARMRLEYFGEGEQTSA